LGQVLIWKEIQLDLWLFHDDWVLIATGVRPTRPWSGNEMFAVFGATHDVGTRSFTFVALSRCFACLAGMVVMDVISMHPAVVVVEVLSDCRSAGVAIGAISAGANCGA
jgi:hypothetical protein